MRTVSLLSLSALASIFAACPADEPPPLTPPEVGIIVGEVFASDGSSLGGASVEVYGTSSQVISEAGKQFVLGAIPKGAHTVLITSADGQQAVRATATIEQRYQTVTLRAQDTTLAQVLLRGTVTSEGGSSAGAVVYLVGGNSRQVALVGDDGSFALTGLPSGSAQIAFSKAGYDTVLKTMDLAEGENTAEAVSLVASSAGNLSLAGRAQLDGETDHRGVAILLNGGEQVTTTDEDGAYQFGELSPGAYSIRAQAPGHRSVELAAVALDASGEAHGLVDLFLAQGADEPPPSEGEQNFLVEVVSPAAGAIFERGESVVLLANASLGGVDILPGHIGWSYDDCSSQATATPLGSGNPLPVDTLPEGDVCITMTATSLDGATASARTAISVVPIAVGVTIASHSDGDHQLASVPFFLSALVNIREGIGVDDNDVVWSYRAAGSADPLVELGRGVHAIASFPPVSVQTLYDVVVDASVQGGAGRASAIVGLYVDPLKPAPDVQAQYQGRGLQSAPLVDVTDANGDLVRTEIRISEGQPQILVAGEAGGAAGDITWSSDTGYLFTGPVADLSFLPVGTHNFVLSVSGADGQVGEAQVRVIVGPFVFDLSIRAPVLDGQSPYFVATGVPLDVGISHSYQHSFSPTRVRWFHATAGQIAVGQQARSFALPPGPGILWVEAEDAVGHVVRRYQEYVLQDIDFTAVLLTPDDGTDVLEGTAIDFNSTYTHSLVPSVYAESDLKVRYFSSIQGLLRDSGGRFEFAPSETLTTDGLVPGTHTITVRITDGALFAEDSRTLYVRSPGLEASLISPADETLYFDGDAVLFRAQVTHDVQVTPTYSWYLDGQEFDAGWGGYGSDAAAASRLTVDMATYDPSTAPFNDPRWAPGAHEIKFFARLPEVDAQLGCVNIPSKAVCLRFRVHTAPANADICSADGVDHVINTGDVEVWSGVRRLNCIVYLRGGGSLDVLPGARILVAATGNANQRRVILEDGNLTVGRPGAADSVVFQVQGSRAGPSAWRGIGLGSYSSSGPSTATFDKVVIRHAHAAIEGGMYWSDVGQRLEIRDVSIEDSRDGLVGSCADVLERTRFANITRYALDEGSGYNCPTLRSYRGLTFENVSRGMGLRGAGTATLDGIVMSGVDVDGVWYRSSSGVGDLLIRNSSFTGASSSNSSAIHWATCSRLSVRSSVFSDNQNGIYTRNCTGPDSDLKLEVLGNTFERNTYAIRSQQQTHRSDEVHLNSFVDNIWDIYLTGDGADVMAQGNYFGPRGDATTAGGVAMALPVGVSNNLPKIYDMYDNSGEQRLVRFSNTLPLAPSAMSPLPVAYIREPQRTLAYNTDRCIPLIADSPLTGVDVLGSDASGSNCHWWMDGEPGVGTEVFRDSDGCLDTAQTLPGEGVHDLLLECRVLDQSGAEVRRDRHATEFMVDNSAYRGRQWRPSETWSGDVVIDGDIIIPPSFTLSVEPGTTIHIDSNDRLRYRPYIRWANGDHANDSFGLRGKVDFFVQGQMLVKATAGHEIRLEAMSGSAVGGQWGGLRVYRGGTLELDHAEVVGATNAVHGEYKADDTAVVPTIKISNTRVEGATNLSHGAAPVTFVGNTVIDVQRIFRYSHIFRGQLLIDSSSFANIGGTTTADYMYFDGYDQNGPANIELRVFDSSFNRGVGSRRGTAIRTDYNGKVNSLKLIGSQFDNFDAVVYADAPATVVEFTDSSFSSFNRVLRDNRIDELTIDHCSFDSGKDLFAGSDAPAVFYMSRSRLVDVLTPFRAFTLGSDITGNFVVTGNQFEGAQTIWQFGIRPSRDSTYSVDFGGNNYIGTTGLVLDVAERFLAGCTSSIPECDPYGDDYNITFVADMSGSYFGVSTEPEILTLIDDPSAPIAGRQVDHSGWSSVALTTLDIP